MKLFIFQRLVFLSARFALIVIMLNLNVGLAIAASNELYLLTGQPTPKSDAAFPSLLFKLNQTQGNLIQVREVVSSSDGSVAVHPDYDNRFIVVQRRGTALFGEGYRIFFEYIDMDRPEIINSFTIDIPDMTVIESFVADIPQQGVFQVLFLARWMESTQELRRLLLGVSLATLNKSELPWEVYKYARVSGEPGGAVPGGDTISSLYSRGDGELIFKLGGETVITDLYLPKSSTLSKEDRVPIFVNNNKVLVLGSVKSRVKDPKGLGHTIFNIFDKTKKSWDKLQVLGGSTGARGFGVWIAGYVADKFRDKPSAGKEKRGLNRRKTGMPVDSLFKFYDYYSPGILFLYNIKTKKKYLIKTDQGDNEVLLVDGDTVYYRVYDEIYKARIGKNKIEDAVLMVKDDVVPDIHWAFMGPNSFE